MPQKRGPSRVKRLRINQIWRFWAPNRRPISIPSPVVKFCQNPISIYCNPFNIESRLLKKWVDYIFWYTVTLDTIRFEWTNQFSASPKESLFFTKANSENHYSVQQFRQIKTAGMFLRMNVGKYGLVVLIRICIITFWCISRKWLARSNGISNSRIVYCLYFWV